MFRLAKGENWFLVKCGKEYYHFAMLGNVPETGCINEQSEKYNAAEALKWCELNFQNPAIWQHPRLDSM